MCVCFCYKLKCFVVVSCEYSSHENQTLKNKKSNNKDCLFGLIIFKLSSYKLFE